MISLLEYLNRNKSFNIIFELDEESYSLLDDSFKNILESNNNILSSDFIFENNRTIWKSNDGDELKIGDHANSRKDRPIENGGDGKEPIKDYEIVNMFRWAWNNIMDMNYDGKLEKVIYNGRPSSFTIECQCWLNNDKNSKDIKYNGARPKDMNLWAAWLLEEYGTKIDIIIKTIFRGQMFKHSKSQERIRIKANGEIEERYKI